MKGLGYCHGGERGHSCPQQYWKDQAPLETVLAFPACCGQECPRSGNCAHTHNRPPLAAVWVWLAVLLTSLLSGCIVVPLPNRDTGNPRKDLGQPTASRIEPGVATIEDVLLKLGEPGAVSPDERSLACRSQKTAAMGTAG